MTEPLINRSRLREIWSHVADRVRYLMGAKCRPISADTATLTHLDCSGFVQKAVWYASSEAITLPEGSEEQKEWCEKQGLQKQQYIADAGRSDNQVRIWFISAERSQSARGNQSARHVWLTLNGKTMECHGGNGCVSRSWSTPVLTLSDAGYLIPSSPS